MTPVQGSVAFDTGAENTTQTVPNRNDSATIELTIADNVGGEPTATGTFGGSVLNLQASTEKGDTITWTNATAWKNTPSLLPHSGDVITVTYQDCVGHTVTHTITVERSPASSGLSINVRPMGARNRAQPYADLLWRRDFLGKDDPVLRRPLLRAGSAAGQCRLRWRHPAMGL